MGKATKDTVRDNREDLSRFVVHLTRDDKPDVLMDLDDVKPKTAAKNLRSILDMKTIEARAPHCIVNPRLKDVAEDRRKEFHVVCLTEVPLNQIHLLTQDIEGRKVKLKPYGLVFDRHFVIKKGGQPAIYVNGYEGNTYLKEAVDELYEHWLNRDEGVSKAHRLLPFVNAMHEGYDFAWEREWRVLGDLTFERGVVVAIILPEEGEEDLREAVARCGVPVISPRWTFEQIVAELSSQQRKTMELLQKKREGEEGMRSD